MAIVIEIPIDDYIHAKISLVSPIEMTISRPKIESPCEQASLLRGAIKIMQIN